MSESQSNEALDQKITATWERVPSGTELKTLLARLAMHPGLEETELDLDNAA